MHTRLHGLLCAAVVLALAASGFAWADVPACCGNELIDPGFEDMANEGSYWISMNGNSAYSACAARTGQWGLWGAAGDTVYQIFDESLIWTGTYTEDDGTRDYTWTSEPNPCWCWEQNWKEFDLTAWLNLDTDDTVAFRAGWWCNSNGWSQAPTLQTPGLTWARGAGGEIPADTWTQWQAFDQFEPGCQPRWMVVSMTFTDTNCDGPYIDDLRAEGRCSPELGTWALLLATGAFGGWIKRRRKEN